MKTNSASQSNSGHRSTASAISNKQKALLRIAKAQLGFIEEEYGDILPNHGGRNWRKTFLMNGDLKPGGQISSEAFFPFYLKE